MKPRASSLKIYKQNLLRTRFVKKKRNKTQIYKIRIENEEVTIDYTEIQWTLRKYYEQLYANKLDNLVEMGKFLEIYNLSKLNQDESENLNRPITTSEIKTVMKKLPTKR